MAEDRNPPAPFLDDLVACHEKYVAQGGRRKVEVELHEGPLDGPKRAAWIVARWNLC